MNGISLSSLALLMQAASDMAKNQKSDDDNSTMKKLESLPYADVGSVDKK